MINSRPTPRHYIRLICLILAILLVCPNPFWVYHSQLLVQASSFVAVCALIAGSNPGMGTILGLGFSLAAIMRKRWFCNYTCPVGLILDRVPGAGSKRNTWWKGFPSIGKYIVIVTAAGSLTGYPLFLWMDPLVFFNSALSVYNTENILTGFLAVSGLIFLLILTVTSGSLWCARICPLGATQDFLSKIGQLLKKLHNRKKEKNINGKPDYSFAVTRRGVLAIAAGAGLGFLAKSAIPAQENALLHPPGAAEKSEFNGRCVRCGNCMRACPSKIIYPDIGRAGVLGFMAPVLSFDKGYCIENCNDCTKVCPSGALKKLTLERKNKYKIGEAVLNPALCYMVRGVNDCDICVRSCPFDAVQVYWNEESYVAFPFIDSEKCNGCGACERFCPTGHIRAITVREVITH